MKLPLEGLRILAVEQYGAGPYGSCHLADMGAEVIKIEHREAAVTWRAASGHISSGRTTANSSRPSIATRSR